ncbi:hypothetical protein CUT44_18195 [Streptomyces carminius]|uniref:Uncharacterized protein n=1 Tax=Streptomyces carminius TaxID=2665496 RepID=A0A2M8LWY0_9ACTN|nr:hypothetical protein [Streptomyces carminius]PJE96435.1 hypothetical protein CUT44_18195 [Streptomyces carminius]
MKHAARTALVLAGAGAGAVALRKLASPPADVRRGERWLVVTVNRPPQAVLPDGGRPPRPLDEFGDDLEVAVRPAPGGRGTELAARLREGSTPVRAQPAQYSLPARLAGEDPRQPVRQALRQAKALLETGEVLRPDVPTAREETLGSRLVGLATRRAGGEGVL